jgi:hypothetical protein
MASSLDTLNGWRGLKSKPAEAAGVADAGGLPPLITARPRVATEIDRGACCHAVEETQARGKSYALPAAASPNSLCLHVSWYGPDPVHGFHFFENNSRFLLLVFLGFFCSWFSTFFLFSGAFTIIYLFIYSFLFLFCFHFSYFLNIFSTLINF